MGNFAICNGQLIRLYLFYKWKLQLLFNDKTLKVNETDETKM